MPSLPEPSARLKQALSTLRSSNSRDKFFLCHTSKSKGGETMDTFVAALVGGYAVLYGVWLIYHGVSRWRER